MQGDEGAEGSSWNSLVIAVVVVIIGYMLFFPGRQDHDNRREAPQQQRQVQRERQRAQGRPAQRPPQNNDEDEEGIQSFLKSHVKKPSHYSGGTGTQPMRPSHDGVLPFRFTKASTFEQSKNDSSQSLENRKDRARVFAKLFANSKTDPPGRGNNIVVSISSSDNESEKLHRVLFLLGSYYNIFVMVSIDDGDHLDDYSKDKERTDGIVAKFFSSDILPKEVLPAHRIVVTRSLSSRIAFVRSFPKSPDLVVGSDNETEFSAQLSKFGYTVILRSLSNL